MRGMHMVRRGQEQIGQIAQHLVVHEKDLTPSERDEATARWPWS